MDDQRFLDYVEAHSCSERHAFSHSDADRLLDLAGEDMIKGTDDCGLPGFVGIDQWAAKPLLEKARKRMRGKR